MVAILGANSVSGQYEISNSLIINRTDTAFLDQTFSSAGNRRTFTISFWVKRGALGATDEMHIYSADADNFIRFESSDRLRFACNTQGVNPVLETNRVFRDPAAWYHIFFAVDTTQSTASNRFKLYVNGVEETSFATDSRSSISQNTDLDFNNSSQHCVGTRSQSTSDSPYDGYITEFHSIDGTAKSHTDFGEFTSDGVWIPKKYSGTYGTNGFYLEFKQTGTSQNSSGIGADTSGNDNHFAVTNLASTDITEDTCTNNFAVCNFLSARGTADLRQGNLILDADSSGDIVAPSTIGFTKGKWYMEIKSTITAGHGNRKTVGVYETDSDIRHPRGFSSSIPYNGVVVDLRTGSAFRSAVDGDATDISSFANNDICGLAYDADNGQLFVFKNGTAQNSGNALNSSALDTSKTYAFYFGQDGGGTNHGELFCNFGNPSFTISSGNTDGQYGNFEYAPPSGFYALCTKRLAEFG